MTASVDNHGELKDLFSFYNSTFEKYSYNNSLYSKMSLHVILGQILRDVKVWKSATYLDSRMSFFLLQPSGSGKTTAFKFIKDVAEGVGLKVASLDEITDAALVGTVEENTEFGQKELKVVEGILATADIVHYDEASALIKKKEHNKSTLSYFQKSLNPIGDPSNVIFKKLAHGPEIKLPSNCSYILTSFIPPGIIDTIVNTGFFQRLLVATRRLSRAERRKNSMLDIDNLGIRTESEYDNYAIIRRLEEIRKFAMELDYNITISERVKPLLRNKVTQYYKAIEAPNQNISNLLDTFVPRYQDHLYRVSVHSAAMNFSDTVRTSDVNYAFNLIFPIFKMLLSWMESDTEVSATPQKEKDYLKIMRKVYTKIPKLKDGKWVGSTQFVEALQKYMRASKPTIYSYLKLFTDQKWMTAMKEGRRTWYCMPQLAEKKARIEEKKKRVNNDLELQH